MEEKEVNPHQAVSSRRAFLKRSGVTLAGVAMAVRTAAADKPAPKVFRLWASGDSHVGTDLKKGRESLADAIRQSEQGDTGDGLPFGWDNRTQLALPEHPPHPDEREGS